MCIIRFEMMDPTIFVHLFVSFFVKVEDSAEGRQAEGEACRI